MLSEPEKNLTKSDSFLRSNKFWKIQVFSTMQKKGKIILSIELVLLVQEPTTLKAASFSIVHN